MRRAVAQHVEQHVLQLFTNARRRRRRPLVGLDLSFFSHGVRFRVRDEHRRAPRGELSLLHAQFPQRRHEHERQRSRRFRPFAQISQRLLQFFRQRDRIRHHLLQIQRLVPRLHDVRSPTLARERQDRRLRRLRARHPRPFVRALIHRHRARAFDRLPRRAPRVLHRLHHSRRVSLHRAHDQRLSKQRADARARPLRRPRVFVPRHLPQRARARPQPSLARLPQRFARARRASPRRRVIRASEFDHPLDDCRQRARLRRVARARQRAPAFAARQPRRRRRRVLRGGARRVRTAPPPSVRQAPRRRRDRAARRARVPGAHEARARARRGVRLRRGVRGGSARGDRRGRCRDGGSVSPGSRAERVSRVHALRVVRPLQRRAR